VKHFTFERRGSSYHDANPLREASVPSLDKLDQSNHGIDWRGIVAILVVQLAVLLAVSGAVIFYLDWSSNTAQAEFMRTIESASGPSHLPQPPTAIQPVKSRTACPRRA
jgi:hypothetical protein